MAKKPRPIDKLIDGTGVTSGRPLRESLPKEVAEQLEADLQAIVAAKRAGKPTPSLRRLADYALEEYGVSVSSGAIRNWILRIERGGRG